MADKVTKQLDLKVSATGAEQVPGVFAKIGQSLKQLNKDQEAGGLKTLVETLKGGAVVAGVVFALDSIGKMGHAAAEGINAYKEGTKTATAATLDFVESIPLLGKLVTAARGISEAIDALAHGPTLRYELIDTRETDRQSQAFIFSLKQMKDAANDFYATRNKSGLSADLAKVAVEFGAASREIDKFYRETEDKKKSATEKFDPHAMDEYMAAQEAIIARSHAVQDKLQDDTINALLKGAGAGALDLLASLKQGGTDASNYLKKYGDESARIRDIDKEISTAMGARLSAQGSLGSLAAEELAIKQKIKDQEVALWKIANDNAHPVQQQQAQAEIQKLPQVQAKLLEQNSLNQRDAIFAKEKEINSVIEERLNAQAAYGDIEAGLAAKRLEIEDQVKDRALQLQRLTADTTLPDTVRKAAQAQIALIPKLHAELLKSIQLPTWIATPFSLVESHTLSGVNSDSLAESQKQTAANTKLTNEKLADVVTGIDKMIGAMTIGTVKLKFGLF